ncbi:multiple sugar transport system permease protein [Kribbella aluminosa]|uniref:Multiple sugar transport system permease protein n=1 Tax=Kribbella aluminosa TaxID=416017 RepID=A0ABS4UWK2_9ACTN|nr:carbohydrate ABC transporter permease [Kribbella aluminosa]MBP2356038.1 multiple sugar transport system permease protein [Kribbella aluminosa]
MSELRAPGRHGSNLVAYLILGIGGFLMVFPFLYQLSASFMTNAEVQSIPKQLFPGELRWENYVNGINSFPFWDQLRNTAVFSLIRTVSQVLFCSLAGYAFARMRFPFKNLIFGVLLSILMIPGELLLISQYQIVQALGWLNTMAGLVAPGLVSLFGTFLMRQFFMGLPKELEEAGRIDGAGPATIFFRIMLPLASPGLSALAVVTLIDSWGSFLWPLIVASQSEKMTLAVGIASFTGEHQTFYPQIMGVSLLVMLPMVALFIALQRRVIAGLAFAGMKG